MEIPSLDECFAYMRDFGMYENIRQHSLMVARVADTLHQHLARSQAALPPREAVVAGALLHDIAKSICLEQDCKHSQVGEEICQELGYPEIAVMVRDHVVLASFQPQLYAQGIFGASELVYYADKRVKHDQIVSLADRLTYILDKYSNNDMVKDSFIRENFARCQELENFLFARLDFTPESLPERIDRQLFT